MANDNNVSVVGNITRDPELRFTPSGQAVASFGLAVNRRWQNRQTSEWEEATSFFDVTCWAQMAENIAESLHKGARVVVTGRLDQRSWETQEGEKRSKVEIVADEVAPSLRWATAQVVKNEKRGPGDAGGSSSGARQGSGGGQWSGGQQGGGQQGGGQQGGGQQGGGQQGGGQQGGGQQGGGQQGGQPSGGYDSSEEPF